VKYPRIPENFVQLKISPFLSNRGLQYWV